MSYKLEKRWQVRQFTDLIRKAEGYCPIGVVHQQNVLRFQVRVNKTQVMQDYEESIMKIKRTTSTIE